MSARELRTKLEEALLLFDRIGEHCHGEDCPAQACEDDDCDCPHELETDDEADEPSGPRVHDRENCECIVWEAQDMAAGIRVALILALQAPAKEQH